MMWRDSVPCSLCSAVWPRHSALDISSPLAGNGTPACDDGRQWAAVGVVPSAH